jgi:DNA invertase Pin-like site-specific DNA recombinase
MELEAKGELETLARHKKILLDLAKSRGLSIGRIYEEIVSGESIEARPVVQQLLEDVEQGLWEGVLVMEVERLARGDTIDQGIVARAFKMGNTKIITPIKSYDPNNEFDEEYFEFGLFMSRREYKTITRRIQTGRIASAKEGRFVGSTPPYGYDRVRIKGDKGFTLVPNPDEAPVVKMIYDLYTSGNGMTTIAAKLDSMGIRPRNTEKWERCTISDILKNPVYIGKIRWSYRQEKKIKEQGETKVRRIVNKSHILVDGLHPAIITESQFKEAQEVRKRNTRKTTKKNFQLQNPLAGIVYCNLCGRPMTRLAPNYKTHYDALKCPNRYCNNVSAPIFLVEQKILESLRIWIEKYKIEVTKKEPPKDSQQVKKRALASQIKELETINKQISNTYDLLEQGIYTVEVFSARNAELSQRKASVEQRISELESEIEKDKHRKEVNTEIIPKIVGVLEAYETATSPQVKNDMLHQILEKVLYQKDKPNTKGNLYNDNFTLLVFPKLPAE